MTTATQQSRIRLASEGVLAAYIHDISTPARRPAEGERARRPATHQPRSPRPRAAQLVAPCSSACNMVSTLAPGEALASHVRSLGDTPLAVAGRPRSTHRGGAALPGPSVATSSGHQQRERAPDQRSAGFAGSVPRTRSARSGCMRASPPPLSRRLLGTSTERASRTEARARSLRKAALCRDARLRAREHIARSARTTPGGRRDRGSSRCTRTRAQLVLLVDRDCNAA
jgi:hypothetical protein